MADKMSALAAVRAGYVAGVQPLGIARTFDENARPPVRTSDIVVSATLVKTAATGAVTLATAPSGENWRVEYLAFRNTTAGASTLTVYLVPSGGVPSTAGNAVFVGSIAAGATKILSEAVGYQLAAGERVMCICTADDDFIAFGRLTRITQGAT